mgnify:CR=1 FL=1
MFSFLTDLFKPKPPVAPPITSETSMNFDAEDVGPFMTVLSNNARFGLPGELGAFMRQEVSKLALDETKRWKIDGDFDGSPVQIDIEVYMDDVDAPDLTFFSTKSVIAEIDRELLAFGAAMGK